MNSSEVQPFAKPRGALEAERLTRDGLWKREPVFWPGGKELIYAASHHAGPIKLLRLNLADRSVKLFHSDQEKSSEGEREPSVSADGSVYAYSRGEPANLRPKIVIVDTRQNTTLEITSTTSFPIHPAVSPDGNLVLFSYKTERFYLLDRRKHAGIRQIEMTEYAQKLPALGQPGDSQPSFAPDGRSVVFTSLRDGDLELYSMHVDGSNVRRLTHSRGLDTRPVYSPNGKQIAFTSNRDGNYEIYVMNADGSQVRRVSNHPERDDYPCWHPDGKRLAALSERQGKFDLYLYEVP